MLTPAAGGRAGAAGLGALAAACLAAALAAQPAAAQPAGGECAPGLALALREPGRAACVWEGTAAALGWEVLRGPSPPEPSGCGRYSAPAA